MRVALDRKRFGPWALVTGASSGIGKEFARQIAASGVHIALVARRESLLRTVGAECTRASGVVGLESGGDTAIQFRYLTETSSSR